MSAERANDTTPEPTRSASSDHLLVKLRNAQTLYNFYQNQLNDRVIVRVKVRSRWQRALRFPVTVLSYRRAGVPWRTAFKMANFYLWWTP